MKKICDDPDNCTFSDCPTAFCDKDKPMTTPTPETDAHTFWRITGIANKDGDVVGSHIARKLERERDEARAERDKRREVIADVVRTLGHGCCGLSNQEIVPHIKDLQAELTQLRKVCDELASGLEQHTINLVTPCSQCNKALTNYSTLPHVIKAKGMK